MDLATKRKHCGRIWNASSLVVHDEISFVSGHGREHAALQIHAKQTE